MPDETPVPPDALLLIAPGCTHCPIVLDALARLVKDGEVGRLEVANIAAHPEDARAVGTRSVPWLRIGPFELEGAHSYGELKDWAAAASGRPDYGLYFSHLLQSRRLDRVVRSIEGSPGRLDDLIELIGSPETPMGVRIGVGAVLEDLEGSETIRRAVPQLQRLCLSQQAQVRADACHYLALTGDPAAAPTLRGLLDDEDAEVREIAREALEVIEGTGASGAEGDQA
jgi:hypothetical protein